MIRSRSRIAAPLAVAACLVAGPVSAENFEDIIGQHMVAEALLTAHLVAIAEKAGLGNEEIRAILKDVADNSAIDEFWITDPEGHAVLSNRDVSFTFSPDPAKQPQASAFWPLLTGEKKVVIQKAQKREIDDQIYKYVGVGGIDEHRIVQIGIAAADIASPK
jgi:adenylate cyclase